MITALRDILAPLLRPRYFVAVQERAYLDEPGSVGFVNVPDAAVVGPYSPAPVQVREQTAVAPAPVTIDLPMPVRVRETYLEIQEIGDDAGIRTAFNGEQSADRVVTLLEVLSPWNKCPGKGRREYLYKREKILNSATNLVEIDLLRAGERMNTVSTLHYDYSILVSRAATRPRAALYPFTVRQLIPAFHLPLQPDDEEPLVDVNALLHALYDRAGYDLRINYRTEPLLPFEQDDEAWADALLRNANLR